MTHASIVGCLDLRDDDPASVASDPGRSVPARLSHWASVAPDRQLVTEVEGRSITYGAFEREKLQWIAWLTSMGVARGSRVASLLPGSIDAFLAWLAVAGCGAWEVAVNPDLRGQFLRHVLTDSKVSLALVRPEQADAVREVCPDLAIVVVERGTSPAAAFEPATPPPAPDPAAVSCVIYTSGTTGDAKGVLVSHGQLASIIGRWPRSWVSEDDVVYAPWPMAHVTGRSPIVSMVDVGGQIVVRERFSLREFWPDVRRFGVTSTTVSSVISLLLAQPPVPDDRDHRLRFVWGGSLGSEALEFQERFGARVLGSYGSTEVGFPISHRWLSPETAGVTGWLRNGYDARLVDLDGNDVDPGDPGELLIRPPAPHLVTLGYLDRPEHTARALAGGWYHTGDLMMRRPDGAFRFVDRMTDTIRRFGENISATALEAEVRKDREVVECAALGVPSPITGQDVLLAVVPRSPQDLDVAALWNRLHDRLPRYMVPSRILVVEDLPRSPNGKIRKRVLADAEQLDTAWSAPEPNTRRTNAG